MVGESGRIQYGFSDAGEGFEMVEEAEEIRGEKGKEDFYS